MDSVSGFRKVRPAITLIVSRFCRHDANSGPDIGNWTIATLVNLLLCLRGDWRCNDFEEM